MTDDNLDNLQRMTEAWSFGTHVFSRESRRVERWSGAMNNSYQDSDRFLICSCGKEWQLPWGGREDTEARLLMLEHRVDVIVEKLWGSE